MRELLLIVRPFEDLQSIFPLLIPSTLVLVSILVGVGIVVYAAIREQRQNMLSRFVYLQDEFQKYCDAFGRLATQISNLHHLDLQYGKKYDDLYADTKFWRDAAKNPYATIFVRALHDVGDLWLGVGNFESQGLLMEPETVQMSEERLSHLSSTLSRRKHYRWLLRDLAIDFTDEFDTVNIAEGHMQVFAERLPCAPDDDWRTLSFWQDAINEALGLVEKMLPIVPFIFQYRPVFIKHLGLEILAICVFGLLIPLIGTILQLPQEIGTVLALVSAIGFLVCFALIIVTIYKYISASSIQRPVSKTPI